MKRKLSNRGEQRLHDEIVGVVASYRATIYRKIRVADVIDIDKLATRSAGTYALQAHFDIVVADEDHEPAFAIEYDGGGHSTAKDALKDDIARQADLALFRVSERQLNRTLGTMTFLQYLAHTYYMGREFLRMQRAGELAYDEPFMMSGFLKPDAKHIFDSDFNFTGVTRSRLNRIMHRAGLTEHPLAHLSASCAVLGRDDSSFVAFASLPVKSGAAYGRGRIDIGTPSLGALEELPFGWSALSDFCEGMAFDSLYDEVELLLGSGGHAARSRAEVFDEIDALLAKGYRALRAASGGDTSLSNHAMRFGR